MYKKYRGKLMILLVLILSVSLFVGCSGKNKDSAGDSKTLKIGHVEPEDRSTHRALLEFKKEVEEKTNGEVKIEVHPNGALGGDVQLTEAVAMGTLDMALPATSVLVTYSPEFGVLDMPYLFKDKDSAFAAMDGEVGDHFNEVLLDVGIKNLGYPYNGPRSSTNSVRPIEKPEDYKGIKMRVMESPVFIDFFETLGANATPMSFSELFTGLQQKTVQGQENPPSLIYTNKFYEVQDYLTVSEHVHNFLGFLINQGKYDSLTDEQKAIIEEASHNFVDYQRELEIEDTEKYIELLGTEGGLEVNVLSEEQKKEFRDALEPMYDKYKKQFGEEIFSLSEKYN